MRRHGGQIWCESTVGQGTKMSFTLPIADNFSES
ncbi:MAG: cell wall metabolism sensor histidine kinase WalK [Boseongicola sp.]|nr:cell wall metabolism sensor histidine kinase WalK [Boseongicola sp.]